ncbi:MAG: metallophosphoesterase family protein [Planctomycetota bacterium]|jgi:predicted phosphodiesterase
MRYAIFGDIHGNLEALTAVFQDIEDQGGVDHYLCLGDIVGYGANPEECLALVRERNALTIAGNHDHAAIGCLDISFFNQYAREAAIWTSKALSADSKAYLKQLPLVEHLTDFVLVHGALQTPEAFNYIATVRDAECNFRMMDKPLCFCGHSHVPMTFFDTNPMTYSLDPVIPLEPGNKTIVNAGSVGQPRDEHPESSYALYDEDEETVEIRRVKYDIETAAKKITDAGLPQPLALRLWLGK